MLSVAVALAFVLSGCVVSSTGAPRIVADETAALTGAVHSSQADTVTYWFKYGTTADYGSTTTPQTTFVQQGSTTLSQWVDGLTAGTTYHYQLCSDVPDTLPPSCGTDRVVTTTSGHDSVRGQATYSYTQQCGLGGATCDYHDSFGIHAAVDPSSGTIQGDLTFQGVGPGTPMTGPIPYTGVGTIRCLRVSGNIAVVGYSETIETDFFTDTKEGGLVIEDNGATGDRYLASSWSPTNACPTPSASLFNSGTPHPGDFVVHDG
jgi:hypothetical protein